MEEPSWKVNLTELKTGVTWVRLKAQWMTLPWSLPEWWLRLKMVWRSSKDPDLLGGTAPSKRNTINRTYLEQYVVFKSHSSTMHKIGGRAPPCICLQLWHSRACPGVELSPFKSRKDRLLTHFDLSSGALQQLYNKQALFLFSWSWNQNVRVLVRGTISPHWTTASMCSLTPLSSLIPREHDMGDLTTKQTTKEELFALPTLGIGCQGKLKGGLGDKNSSRRKEKEGGGLRSNWKKQASPASRWQAWGPSGDSWWKHLNNG